MASARAAMDAAKAACQTPTENARVELADLSLQQFEQYVTMRRDLADGRWAGLEEKANRWRDQRAELSKRFAKQSAFGPYGATYFDWFCRPAYKDAARIARECRILTRQPLRQWRYQADQKNEGENQGWFRPEFDDKAWKTTDPCMETWSTLGYHDYLGRMWYRATVDLRTTPPLHGKKVYLWIGNSDGSTRLYLNGQHVKYRHAVVQPNKTTRVEIKDAAVDTGFSGPASFDITDLVRKGSNQITLLSTRSFVNELGIGGLLGPVSVYQDK
jgi:hypothetical protein